MADLSTFKPVFFGEGFYSIPEVISEVAKTFEMPLFNDDGTIVKDYMPMYKTIYQRLRRELESKNLIEGREIIKESERKTKYCYITLNQLLNHRLYEWLCNMAINAKYHEFNKLVDQIKKCKQEYKEITEAADSVDTMEQLPFVTESYTVSEEIKRRKSEIAMDFLFTHFIDLDEKMLRADIENDLSFEKENSDAVDILIHERLMDNKNYYTLKKDN